MKPNGAEFAAAAVKIANRGYSYEEMDCQAFVEAALRDVGVRKNWRGSNHMWRTALSWKGTVEECEAQFGCVPVGAWLFTIKQDGGEKARGYNDNDGNASHVGVYTAQGRGSHHSTTGGTQEAAFPDPKRWTHVGLCSLLDYSTEETPDTLTLVRDGLHEMHNIIEDLLEALG